MRKSIISSVVVLCLLLTGTVVLAQTTTVWNPAGNAESTGLWSEAANWTGGEVPEGDFKVVFNVPEAQACILDEAHMIKQLVMGDNGDGDTLHVAAGGSLTTGVVWSAVGYNAPATMIVDSGATVTFGEHMWVGLNDGSDGVVVLNGGTINVSQMTGLGWVSGKGTVYVNSGDLNLANLHPTDSIKDGSLIDISGGTIYITGDHVAKIDAYVAAGKIVATGETGNVLAYFDVDMGKTVVMDGLPPEARLQVIHNAADPAAASVDIYVNGGLYEDDFAFRAATEFRSVPANVELLIGVAPGNSGSADDVIATFPVTLAADETYVVFANGVLDPDAFAANPDGLDISFKLFPVAPAQEMAMDETQVEFFAFHGATDAPAVDVIARGVGTLVDNAAYGDATPYMPVPPGVYTLDITPAEANDVIVASFEADVSGLAGGAAVLFASGFLDPTTNNDGAAFGLFAALPTGDVVAFPVAEETLPDITDLEGGYIKSSNEDSLWTGPASNGSPNGERIKFLIDNDVETKFLVGADTSWIDFYTTTLSMVTSYAITSANDAPTRDPKHWVFQGWDAETLSWVTLDSVVDNPVWDERFEKRTFEIENEMYFSNYRLHILSTNDDPEGLMQIAEWEIFGELGEMVDGDVTNYAFVTRGSNEDSLWTGPGGSGGSPDAEKLPMLTDNDINTKYLVDAVESWLDIHTTKMSNVTSYTITSANDAPERDPSNWVLKGWNRTTASWDTLDVVVDNPVWEERFETRTFQVANAGEWYSSYRLHITGVNGETEPLMQIAELQLLGEIGEDVPADVTDLKAEVAGEFDSLVWPDGGSPGAEQLPMLFDNNPNTKYLVKAEMSWLDIYTKKESIVNSYAITSANDVPERDPADWDLQGWDGSAWVTLHSVVGQPMWEERFQTKTWEFVNDSLAFSSYRLQINAINGDTQGLMQIAELQLFGELVGNTAPEYPPTSVNGKEQVVNNFRLEQNYPNPFNPTTTINFTLPKSMKVKLTVFDVLGREVTTLLNETMTEGLHNVNFEGSGYASGVYFYRLEAGNKVFQQKMMLVK
jgi:hypothetical protein